MKIILDMFVPDFPSVGGKGNGQPYIFEDDESIPQDVLEAFQLPVIVVLDREQIIESFTENNAYTVINSDGVKEIKRNDD